MLGLRTGWVWLLDQDTRRFYDAAERELPPYLQERVRMAGRRRCWCIDDFRDGELTPTNIDVMECSRLQPAFRGKSAGASGRPALPRQHPALLPGQAARHHERDRSGVAQADARTSCGCCRRSPRRSASLSSGRDWPKTRRAWRAPRSARGSPARSTTRWRRD